MINSTITCCKDCKNRCVGCHSTCQKYMDEKAQYNILAEKERQDKCFVPESGDYNKISYAGTKRWTNFTKRKHKNL